MVQLRWIVFVGSFLISFSNTGKCMEGKDLDFPLLDGGAIQRSLHYLRDFAESPPVIAHVCYEKGESFSDFKAKLEKEKSRFPQGQFPKLFSMDLSQVVFHEGIRGQKTNISDLYYILRNYQIYDLKLSIKVIGEFSKTSEDVFYVVSRLKECSFLENLHLIWDGSIHSPIEPRNSADSYERPPNVFLSFPRNLRKLTLQGERLDPLKRAFTFAPIGNCLDYLKNLEKLKISGMYPYMLVDFISTLNLPKIQVLKINSPSNNLTSYPDFWENEEKLRKLKRLDPQEGSFPALKELELEGFSRRLTNSIEEEKQTSFIWKFLSQEVLKDFGVKEMKKTGCYYAMIFKKEDDKKSIF